MRSLLAALAATLIIATLHGATYVTESNVAIDRCASAWFIKRFVDPSAVFVFIDQGEPPPSGTTFGFYGADFFNKGRECTFTALVKAYEKADVDSLQKMDAIVNDTLSWRQGPNSLARHFREGIDDIRNAHTGDNATISALLPVFDLLYLRLNGDTSALSTEGQDELATLPELASRLSETTVASPKTVEAAITRLRSAPKPTERDSSDSIRDLMLLVWDRTAPSAAP